MPAQLVVASEREEDVRFGEYVAFANNIPFAHVTTKEDVQAAIRDNPHAIIYWAADDPETAEPVGEMLLNHSTPMRVFAITDGPLNTYPHLFKYPAYGHHMFRRYEGEAAPILFSKLTGATMVNYPFNILRYFPEGTTSHRIKLTRSGQKYAAVEAVQSHLRKMDVVSRLAALVAQASDELIMNALFDAPVLPDGTPLRRTTDRKSDFELIEREHVEIDIASSNDYIGVSVSDHFGSLKKGVVLRFLGKDYQETEYIPRANDPGAGLGLHGIIQTGLSLVFVSHPGVKTEVMLFLPRTENYRQFRMGFRFVSILST